MAVPSFGESLYCGQLPPWPPFGWSWSASIIVVVLKRERVFMDISHMTFQSFVPNTYCQVPSFSESQNRGHCSALFGCPNCSWSLQVFSTTCTPPHSREAPKIKFAFLCCHFHYYLYSYLWYRPQDDTFLCGFLGLVHHIRTKPVWWLRSANPCFHHHHHERSQSKWP